MNRKDLTNIRIIPTNKTQNYLIKMLKRSSKWVYIGPVALTNGHFHIGHFQ